MTAGLRAAVAEALEGFFPGGGWEAAGVPLAALGATLAAAALVALYLSRAPRGGGRPARARSLAARGAAPAEIARRTGLSQDAVALLLRGPAAHRRAREAA